MIFRGNHCRQMEPSLNEADGTYITARHEDFSVGLLTLTQSSHTPKLILSGVE